MLPRKEYDEYLQLRKVIPVVKMTPAEKRDWKQAKKEYGQGRYITLEELQRELGPTSKRRN